MSDVTATIVSDARRGSITNDMERLEPMHERLPDMLRRVRVTPREQRVLEGDDAEARLVQCVKVRLGDALVVIQDGYLKGGLCIRHGV